jgi:hypothetical protein
MTNVLATGADARYGYHLVNLLGSVRANSNIFDEIVAFDLGLDTRQRSLLEDVDGVEIRTVPPFVPHWREGRTWKTWIWTQFADGDDVFWLDAGITVLRPLDDAVAQIRARGYFAVSQGHHVRESVPSDYYELYGFSRELGGRESIAAGILGFHVGSEFYERVIVPTFDDAVRGLSIGFSASEVGGLNTGLDANTTPTIRDCTHFRWDQTILNLRFYLGVENPVVADLDEYAGWRSPRDHPRQVIWSHRGAGNMAYLWRTPSSPRNRLFGLRYRIRWWRKLNQKWFARSTYELKARKTLAGLRRSLR